MKSMIKRYLNFYPNKVKHKPVDYAEHRNFLAPRVLLFSSENIKKLDNKQRMCYITIGVI